MTYHKAEAAIARQADSILQVAQRDVVLTQASGFFLRWRSPWRPLKSDFLYSPSASGYELASAGAQCI